MLADFLIFVSRGRLKKIFFGRNNESIFTNSLISMPFERLIRFTNISFLKTADKSMKFYKRPSKETFLKYSIERTNTYLSLEPKNTDNCGTWN